jgi:hypothetical protein
LTRNPKPKKVDIAKGPWIALLRMVMARLGMGNTSSRFDGMDGVDASNARRHDMRSGAAKIVKPSWVV